MKTNKSRILYLLKYLEEQSDEENPVSTSQIIDYLTSIGLESSRKTLPSDIESLTEFGIDIITVKSKQNLYFIGERRFELAELRLLYDAVESSRLVTERKSKELMNKLSYMTSVHQRTDLIKNHCYNSNIKPQNEEIYYYIDTIHKAISKNKKITFKYMTYTPDKKKIQKHKGYEYQVSPYALVWNSDRYYLLGFSKKHNKVATFRIDRIVKPVLLNEEGIPAPSDFSVSDYSKKVFKMYDGELIEIQLVCDNDIINVLIDHFGEHFKTEIVDDSHIKVTVEVAESPTFYGWIFQFCNRMKVIAPQHVVDKIQEIAKQALDNHILVP